jgi:UDP-glucose:(heptosyl)LPS alpha-1,3-glucosyltransferase
VHFVGALADMSIAYRAADMLAHPTLEDSFAMVVLEAMSYGLPVVVSSAKYCGISQFLQGGIDALLLDDPHDMVSLGAAIKQIFSDANLSQALSTEGLRFAAQHQWHSAVDRYSQLYAEITLQSHQRLC